MQFSSFEYKFSNAFWGWPFSFCSFLSSTFLIMKIDREKIKKSPYELPFASRVLISKLMSCSDDNQLTDVLTSIVYSDFGVSDLYHWVDVLDKFDTVLEECCIRSGSNHWSQLAVDLPANIKKKKLVMAILNFFSKMAVFIHAGSIFNSTEHLDTLLWSVDMRLVSLVLSTMCICVYHKLFVPSPDNKWLNLRSHVLTLAKSWGGKESDIELVQCIKDESFPVLTTSLNFECPAVGKDDSFKQRDLRILIRMDNLADKQIGTIMTEQIELHHVLEEYQFELFNKIRLIQCFSQCNTRLEYVRARIFALTLVASCHDDTSAFYPGLVKELADILSVTHLDQYKLTEIQHSAVNCLSALMTFGDDGSSEKMITFKNINSLIGPLSIMVDKTIHQLISLDHDTTDFHDDLFYLLAASDATGLQAISQNIPMDSLLKLVKWEGPTIRHMRIVRYVLFLIIELSESYQLLLRNSNALDVIAHRFEHEVNICLLMQPDENETCNQSAKHYFTRMYAVNRMLSFLKASIKFSSSADIRRLMSGSSFPQALQDIIRYSHFFGSLVFAKALEFITSYIHQNPFNLSSLQDSGFSDHILGVLLKKNIPITKKVLIDMPAVFGALCINSRGMESFLAMKPFERMFEIFTSVHFLREIRKQREESVPETVDGFATAIAELVRHHSSLGPIAINAMIALLNEICRLGTEPKYICSAKFVITEDQSDDYEDHRIVTQPWIASNKEVVMTALSTLNGEYQVNLTEERIRIPLHEYILNSTKFINTFLRPISVENCKEFLRAGGLNSVLNLLNLPNTSPTEHLIEAYLGVIMLFDTLQTYTMDNSVLSAFLRNFDSHIAHLNCLMNQLNCSTGSSFLEDLFLCLNSDPNFLRCPFLVTPTLQSLSTLYIFLRIISYNHDNESYGLPLKSVLIRQWTSQLGLRVIDRLSKCCFALHCEKAILSKFSAVLTDEQPKSDSFSDQMDQLTKIQIVLDTVSPQPPVNVKVIVRQFSQKIINLIDLVDSSFHQLFGKLVQLSLIQPESNSSALTYSPALIVAASMKVIKDAFWWQAPMNDVDIRSKFCASFVYSASLTLFDNTKPNNLILYHFEHCGAQDAFFELPAQVIGDINSYSRNSRKLSNDVMDLLDSWLDLLQLLTNHLNVDNSLLSFDFTLTKRHTNEYIILTQNKAINYLAKLWNVELLRQFSTQTLSRLLIVIANLLNGYDQVDKNWSSRMPFDETPMTFTIANSLIQLDLLVINIENDILGLLEDKPSMVCEFARLLYAIAQHNGVSLGIGGFIRGLIEDVIRNATSTMDFVKVACSENEKIKLLASDTTKLTSKVHLLAVLAVEMPFACAKEMCLDKCHLMSKLYDLLEITVLWASKADDSNTLQLPQWLCPLILLIDQNEKNLVVYTQRVVMRRKYSRNWKIYKWSHSISLYLWKNQIDKAYQNGQPYYRYKWIDNCHYMAHFGSMNLFCEETGQCKPIYYEMDLEGRAPVSRPTHSIEQSRAKFIIETMVTLLKLPSIDANIVEAIVRICLRVTRNHSMACHFAQLGGITTLLNLTTNLQFDGTVPMTTLLIRHVYENERVLRCSMNNEFPSFFQMSNYEKCPFSLLFQFMNSAACRDKSLCTEWAKSLVNSDGKICFCPKCVVPCQLKPEEQSEQSKEVTKEMLNVLAERLANEQDIARPKMEFVFTTSKLLAILAELCALCKPNNELVFGHKYNKGHTEQITKDCSVLEFVFDNMLHASSANDFNFIVKVLFEFMSTNKQVFCKVIEELDAALSRVLSNSDSADKHQKIKSICLLIEKATEHFTKSTPSLIPELLKMVEKCLLIPKLASAIDVLNLSSPHISTSVNGILKTLEHLIDFVNTTKRSTNSMASNANIQQSAQVSNQPMPQLTSQPSAITPTQQGVFSSPYQTSSDQDIIQPVSSGILFRHTQSTSQDIHSHADDDDESDRNDTQAEIISDECAGHSICPLLHPCLLINKSSLVSNPVDAILHYLDCQLPFDSMKKSKCALRDDQVTYSLANSVITFHGFSCMCSLQNQLNTQMQPCSRSQWFMESCIVDGQFQFDAVDLVKAEILEHRQKIIEKIKNEREKKTKDVAVKVTEKMSSGDISLASFQSALDVASKENVQSLAYNSKDENKLDFSKDTKESLSKEQVRLEQSKNLSAKESPITNSNLTPQQRAILGDGPIPEGLDPAILVELPGLRLETIEQQRQINNAKQTQGKQQGATAVVAATGSNVTQVILPNIPTVDQGQQQPEDATNTAAQVVNFIQSLEPMVRRQVLTEMDEGQLQFLPDQIVTEARVLQQEEARRLQELENAVTVADNQQDHFPTGEQNQDNPPTQQTNRQTNQQSTGGHSQTRLSVPMNGPQMIDIDGLSSLLLLLFVKNDSIDRARFHSVMASFCSHQPTRKWMVYSLLDIMERANPPTNPLSTVLDPAIYSTGGNTSWKSITIESTFGARLRVLRIDPATEAMLILPQAANLAYDNVLNLFLVLTKTFPDFCFPDSDEQQPSSNEKMQ